MKKIGFLMLLLINSLMASAQSDVVEMMDKDGKIYVVIATIAIIFIGIAIYLFSIDRRLKKIEKEN
ncbi:MAG: CcmD family protein [Mucilaginibacter sp.]